MISSREFYAGVDDGEFWFLNLSRSANSAVFGALPGLFSLDSLPHADAAAAAQTAIMLTFRRQLIAA
jgi:hypothetical protein